MSSDREPIPRSAVVRANKTAPQPRAEAPPPLPVGDAGPSAVVEKKKKKKLPKTGPVAHVEDADKRVYARPAGSTTQITSIIPDAAVTADVDEFDGDEEEEDDDMEEAIAAPLAAPVVTLTEFKRRVDLVLREFFLEGDFDEARRSFGELGAPFFGFVYVRRLLVRAMEAATDKLREQASRLLSLLYGDGSLSAQAVGKGFESLFESLEDVRLDVHDADAMAAKFVARAVADEILPPAFLSDPLVAALGGDVIDSARALLAARRSAERLEHVWGVTEAFELADLKAAVQAAVAEYFGGGGLEEIARCVRELAAPHFHRELMVWGPATHTLQPPVLLPLRWPDEVIFRALQWTADHAPSPPVEAAALALVQHLAQTVQEAGAGPLIPPAQVAEGFRRAHERLGDIKLDAPGAPAALARLAAAAEARGLLPPGFSASYTSPEAT